MGCPRIYGQTQALAQYLVVQSDGKHNSNSFILQGLANACPPFLPAVERVQVIHLLDPSQGQSTRRCCDKPKKRNWNSSEIPFLSLAFYCDRVLDRPVVFFQSITVDFPLASSVINALLLGQVDNITTVGRAFAYSPVARLTMRSHSSCRRWRRTLAVTLVPFDTRNPAAQRLIDGRLLNVALALLLTTSILRPVLTEHLASRLLKDARPPDRMKADRTP
jgi:hypothetical protein